LPYLLRSFSLKKQKKVKKKFSKNYTHKVVGKREQQESLLRKIVAKRKLELDWPRSGLIKGIYKEFDENFRRTSQESYRILHVFLIVSILNSL
jgi:hypothetical protein